MIYLLPHSIDEAAQTIPEKQAFLCDSETITYGELCSTTNQIAHALTEHGTKRGDRVGVLMPRCLESVLAIYGIMKAGAAYVPMDPLSSVEVLRGLIESCGINTVITHGQKARRLEELAVGTELRTIIGARDISVSCLSWEEIASFPTSAPQQPALEHDLAYIIFTSGSTGRPKGIMHTHHSGLSYARLTVDTYDLRESDIIGSHSPLHFDMSTFGNFAGPLARATTSVIPEAYVRLPASLSELIERHRITVWYSVPFALIDLHLRGVLDSRDCSSLRWAIYAGEPFPTKHLLPLMQRWPHVRFSNVYGPAETNQCPFYHLGPAGQDPPPADLDSVPLGVTWDNTEGLVIDEHDQPVTTGEVGELLIRSSTMMRGYWGRDGLNAAAFLNRVGPSGLAQTYSGTGDLVRVNENGNYIFLGRRDRQVKVRGHRIELDAVEEAIASHPAVEEAGAFVAGTASDMASIGGAVTIRASKTTTPESIIAHASRVLPAYAVPDFVQVLTQLPRTSTGKIDRRHLAEMYAKGNPR